MKKPNPNQPELFPTTISSPLDTHVSHSAWRANGEAKKIRETSGLTCMRLLKENTPLGVFSKTFMVTLPWDSTRCLTKWKWKGTPHKRLLFQLVALMHPTSVIDSGLLHTPTAKANQLAPSMVERDKGSWGLWLTPTANSISNRTPEALEKRKKYRESIGRKTTPPGNLAEQVQHGSPVTDMWPTPQARDWKDSLNTVPPSVAAGRRGASLGQKLAERMLWPTPNAWDGSRGPRSEKNLQEKNHMVNLITAVQTDQRRNEQETGGSLNPTWVEWLMGYPQGWTDLED